MIDNLFIDELTMDYDIYINYDKDEKMTSFHLVNKYNPICHKYNKVKIHSDFNVCS